MAKPLIVVPATSEMPRHPWNRNLITCLLKLADLGLADIRIGKVPFIGRIKGVRVVPRPDAGTVIFVNNKVVYLDTWDYSRPTLTILKIIDEIDVDIKAVVKIQRRKDYDFPNKRNIPVLPWTMFHTAQPDWLEKQPTYKEAYEQRKRRKWRIGFSGRIWKHRRLWVEALKKVRRGHFHTWKGRVPKDPVGNYIRHLCNWRCILILQGKRDSYTDGKNRREVECSSIGMPMILNYKPYYLNELVPGKHYIYIDSHNKIEEALSKLTPEFSRELTNNAYEWWKANASLDGLCRTFIQCIERLGII